jgi:hypothetical protein
VLDFLPNLVSATSFKPNGLRQTHPAWPNGRSEGYRRDGRCLFFLGWLTYGRWIKWPLDQSISVNLLSLLQRENPLGC